MLREVNQLIPSYSASRGQSPRQERSGDEGGWPLPPPLSLGSCPTASDMMSPAVVTDREDPESDVGLEGNSLHPPSPCLHPPPPAPACSLLPFPTGGGEPEVLPSSPASPW